jgi:hypothetical protein
MRNPFRTAGRTLGALVLACAALAGAALVTGCSTGPGSGSSASNADGAQAPRGAEVGAGGTSSGTGTSGGTDEAAGSKTKAADTRSLIVMAALQLSVRDPAQSAGRAEQTALAAGGYVAAESVGVGPQGLPAPDAVANAAVGSATGVSPLTLPEPDAATGSEQALLVLRIPPARLADVLAALSGSGSVAYRTRSETDVTGQVADVDSRVASAQAAITELRGMIGKAASMNDLISLEQALADRESDLESLEAQQRALADQVAYATVTVGYFTPSGTVVATAARHRNPFAAGLSASWHAVIALGRGLLAAAGWLLPFAVLLVLIGWPARRLVRNRRRRRPAQAAEEG